MNVSRAGIRYWIIGCIVVFAGSVQAQTATDLECRKCVDASDIATKAVTTGKLENNSVTSKKIAHGAVNANKIAGGSVSSAKIQAGAVTSGKIALDAVGLGQIDPTQVQVRVGGGCSAGSTITDINEDGSVACSQFAGPLRVFSNGTPIGFLIDSHSSGEILGNVNIPKLRFATLSNTDYLFSVGTGGSLKSQDLLIVQWQTVNCTGPAFILPIDQYFSDQGLVFRDSGNIANAPNFYVVKGTTIMPNVLLGSLRNINGCQNIVKTSDVMPVFPNDPAVTGVNLTEGDFDRPIIIGGNMPSVAGFSISAFYPKADVRVVKS